MTAAPDDLDRWKRCYDLTREIVLENKTVDPNDSPEKAELRARLVEQIAVIKARRGIVDIPPE